MTFLRARNGKTGALDLCLLERFKVIGVGVRNDILRLLFAPVDGVDRYSNIIVYDTSKSQLWLQVIIFVMLEYASV